MKAIVKYNESTQSHITFSKPTQKTPRDEFSDDESEVNKLIKIQDLYQLSQVRYFKINEIIACLFIHHISLSAHCINTCLQLLTYF